MTILRVACCLAKAGRKATLPGDAILQAGGSGSSAPKSAFQTRTMKIYICCLALWLLALPVAESITQPPNIVFFFADDLGWGDVSFHGCQIPTPNLDTLAADGVILNSYYVLPSCTPSRAALLTGLYAMRTGMQGGPLNGAEPRGLPSNVKILPQYLKDLGYETHLVGKWHQGYYTEDITPTRRGFDSFYGFYNGKQDHYTHNLTVEDHNGLDFWLNTRPLWSVNGFYSTHLYTKRAQHLISNRQESKPLLLMLSYQAPHVPLQAPQENIDKFPYIGDRNRTVYAGMVDALDQSVGQVVQALNDAHILNNTVIVFSSDNGHPSYNWPLRGGKGSVWEGGTRAAAFVWSPLLAQRRRVSHGLMHLTDWLPTFYSIAGGDAAMLARLDGQNMWEHLSQGKRSARVEMLYNYDDMNSNSSALRDTRYKLVLDGSGVLRPRQRAPGGRRPCEDLDGLLAQSAVAGVLKDFYKEDHLDFPSNWRRRAAVTCGQHPVQNISSSHVYLFDILADPCELNNLAGSLPAVVASLKERIDVYGAAAMPSVTKPSDPAGFPENNNGIWAPWVPSS